MTYQIIAARPSAALYLAWEFGITRANQMLQAALPATGSRGFIQLPEFGCFLADYKTGRRTKRMAENYAQRIRQAVAYQEGRLGRAFSSGHIYVRG